MTKAERQNLRNLRAARAVRVRRAQLPVRQAAGVTAIIECTGIIK
ncbi:MAG: hypothetical protein AB1341_15585 [Bacillota bacterium]